MNNDTGPSRGAPSRNPKRYKCFVLRTLDPFAVCHSRRNTTSIGSPRTLHHLRPSPSLGVQFLDVDLRVDETCVVTSCILYEVDTPAVRTGTVTNLSMIRNIIVCGVTRIVGYVIIYDRPGLQFTCFITYGFLDQNRNAVAPRRFFRAPGSMISDPLIRVETISSHIVCKERSSMR